MTTARNDNVVVRSLSQIGACGIFLLTILAAIPRSFCHGRETIRQIWFVGAMSLTIVMTCGLFVGMVLGLQLYYVLSIFGGTAALGTVVSLSLYRELGPVVTGLLLLCAVTILVALLLTLYGLLRSQVSVKDTTD